MGIEAFEERLVSETKTFLRQLQNKKLINLKRCSWDSAKDTIDFLEQFEGGFVFERDSHKIFSFCDGAIFLEFEDNLLFGLGFQESLWSITAWNTAIDTNSLCDCDDYLFDAKEYEEWSRFINKKIIGLNILRQKEEFAISVNIPCEVGLLFQFEDELNFVVNSRLADDCCDFAITESINDSWNGKLDYINVF